MQLVKVTSQSVPIQPLMYLVSATSRQGALGQILQPGYVTLNKTLNYSVPQFPHPYNGNTRTYLRGLLGGLND